MSMTPMYEYLKEVQRYLKLCLSPVPVCVCVCVCGAVCGRGPRRSREVFRKGPGRSQGIQGSHKRVQGSPVSWKFRKVTMAFLWVPGVPKEPKEAEIQPKEVPTMFSRKTTELTRGNKNQVSGIGRQAFEFEVCDPSVTFGRDVFFGPEIFFNESDDSFAMSLDFFLNFETEIFEHRFFLLGIAVLRDDAIDLLNFGSFFVDDGLVSDG